MKRIFSIFFVVASILPLTAWTADNKVLVVLSSKDHIDLRNGKTFRTGFYLNELMVPVKAMIDAGYQPVFATPSGNVPSMDLSSDNLKYFGGDQNAYAASKALLAQLGLLDPAKTPVKSLDEILKTGVQGFSGLFIPGGHAPMADLATDSRLGTILKDFHARQVPTAIICHGPVALLSTLEQPNSYLDALEKNDTNRVKELSQAWIYRGYDLTVFSTEEEKGAESKLGGPVMYYPQDALSQAGANVSVAPKGASHTVRCKELLTGQNPYSDRELADKFIAMLH